MRWNPAWLPGWDVRVMATATAAAAAIATTPASDHVRVRSLGAGGRVGIDDGGPDGWGDQAGRYVEQRREGVEPALERLKVGLVHECSSRSRISARCSNAARFRVFTVPSGIWSSAAISLWDIPLR